METGAAPVLSAERLVEAWAAHEREHARLALAARRLERSGEWATEGFVSMAAWLRHRLRVSRRDAAALLTRGRFLDQFPALAEAATSGMLSAGQVAAFGAVCTPAVEAVLSAQQEEIVAVVAPLSVADTVTVAAAWRQRAEALVELPEPVEPERELRMASTVDGIVGQFVLDQAAALEFQQAIRLASTWDGDNDARSPRRRSADALVDVVAFYNANHGRLGTPRHRAHVELHLEADAVSGRPMAWSSDHRFVGASATEAYLCDCVLHRVTRAGDAVLTYGRAVRTVPRDMFRAVAARDGGCRFPGCDRPVRHCDAHHIRHWRHMGCTDLDNLMLLCNRHHHIVHRQPWELKLLPDATVVATSPAGRTFTGHPRGRPARSP